MNVHSRHPERTARYRMDWCRRTAGHAGRAHGAEQLAAWFRARYDQTAPETRVRQFVVPRSACA